MDPHKQAYWDAITKAHPWMRDILYPKRYVPTEAYYNPLEASGTMAHVLEEVLQASARGDTYLPRTTATTYPTVGHLIHLGMPTYFVTPALLEAALATNIPPTLATADMHWPLEAVLFVLPQKALQTPSGNECQFLAISHNKPSDSWQVHPRLPVADSTLEDVTWMGLTTGLTYAGNLQFDKDKVVDWLDQELVLSTTLTEDKADSFKEEASFTKVMRQVVLRLLLIMSARQDLLSEGKCVRPARTRHGKTKDALWTPNVLGRNYVVKRSEGVAPDQALPVRLHWVRGHLRQQPYGSRDKPRYETIWIEPYIAGT